MFRHPAVLVLLLAGIHGSVVFAQAADSSDRPGPTRAAVRAGISRGAGPEAVAGPIDPGESRRSPVIAAAASVLVPGLGSFYAGHPRHGVTHLAIHVLAGSYVLGNTMDCVFSWGGETGCPGEDALAVASLAWLANWGWSVVSAARDAQAFNARR